MKRYGKLFDSGHWLDAQWWYPEADFLQLGESYDAQGIAYNALAAELAERTGTLNSYLRDKTRDVTAYQARIRELEARIEHLRTAANTSGVRSEDMASAIYRVLSSSPMETGAKRCTCDNEDPFKCKCRESSAACHCVCHGL